MKMNDTIYNAFDFFDTVIHRNCHPEVILFSWAKEVANKLKYRVSPSQIYKIRKRIEIQYKKEENIEELKYSYLLEKIYEEISKICKIEYTGLEFVFLTRKIELNIEIENIYLDDDTVELIKSNKSKGQKNILISDFYADTKFITDILKSLDIYEYFDEIFISSDYGVRKSSGNLYKVVTKKLGIPMGNLKMIGDNIESDYNIPKSMGIEAIHREYHDNNTIITNKELSKMYDEILFSNSNEKPFNGFLEDIVYFISKLHERLVKNGVKKVSFCSREGQLLKVLFDMYQEIFFKNDIIESKYLYVSRRSTLYPSFSKDLDTENFEIIFRQCKRISLENFLANLDISDDDINKIAYQMEVDSNIELESESKLLKKLKNNQLFAKLYLEKKKLSEVFSEYISEFLDNDILNLVDVGWKGTIQDNIQKSLPKLNIRGYYLGLIFNDYSFVQKENKTALLFTDYPNKSLGFDILYRNFGFYEEIFVANHGPVIGYEKKGDGIIPIFDMDKKHTNIYRFVKEYQEKMIVGYSELLESYKKTCYLPNEKYILTLEKSLKKECLFIPKIIDLESKLKANTEENFGNIKENNEIKQVNFKRVLKTRKDFLWVDYYYKLVPFKILANALCRLIYRIKWFQYIYGRK